MARKTFGQRGMSLVEVTIILMTLALLTAVIAPSMADYINDARQTKAKEDVEAIGTGLARMLRDAGVPFALRDGTVAIADRYKKANRVDVLYGPGAIASVDTTAHPNFLPGAADVTTIPLNWGLAPGAGVQSLEAHLVVNTPTYASPINPPANGSGGPRFAVGWRGAYISGLSADPWGNRYEVNSVLFGASSDSGDKGWNHDVVVISAGANSVMDSNFAQPGFTAGIDDVIYVLQGSTR